MEVNQSNTKDLGNLSIKDLFFKYVRFLPVFLVSVAVFLLVAYLYLRYSTPIYRVGGTLTFKMENTGGRGDKFNDIFLAKSINDVQTEIEILKSQPLMERAIDSAKLQTNYFAVGKIKSLNIYKSCPFRLEIFELDDSSRSFSLNVLFVNNEQFRINKEKNTFSLGQIFKNAYGVFRLSKLPGVNIGKNKEFNVTWSPTTMQAGVYAPMIRVSPKIAGSNIYYIQIDYTNAQLGADIINNLMREYLKASIEDKNVTINQTLDYINQQLSKLETDLDSIVKEHIALKKKYNLSDVDAQTKNYFNITTDADKLINEQLIKIQVIDIIEQYLKNAANNFEKVPSSLGVDDPSVDEQVQAYNRLQAERKNMLANNIAEAHPQVVAKNQEIEIARKNLLEALQNVKKLTQTVIDSYNSRSNTAENRIKSIPEQLQELLEIERKKDSKLYLLKFLQEKREETAMSLASTISNSKILQLAYSTDIPIKPNRKGIQLLAIILGIGFPAMFIFFREIVNDKINTRYDIIKITEAPILGEVGHSYSSSSMMVSKTNRSMVSEQFRIIRSNLQYILNKVEKPVIMITSSFSSEGKSFITTNLGGVMALAGKKTVILEFDIRKPKLFAGLKLASPNGITKYLVGKSKFEDLPVKVPGFENLYAISCGPVPPNPSELLLDSRVSELFDWLRANFEVVILDTAPVGMVSDAMTLGKFADSTLYIVRQGVTYKKQILLIDEFYQENRLPKISIVLNDVRLKPGYGYYGYGRYGYGYGYGGGYYETEEGVVMSKRSSFINWVKNIFR